MFEHLVASYPDRAAPGVRFNINHYVRVRLTPLGREILHHERIVVLEVDGWSRWQLWELMQMFGPHMVMGCDLPFETYIELLGDTAKIELV